jgi:hypothetical protein
MVTVQMSAPRALVSSDVMFAVSKLSRAGEQTLYTISFNLTYTMSVHVHTQCFHVRKDVHAHTATAVPCTFTTVLWF